MGEDSSITEEMNGRPEPGSDSLQPKPSSGDSLLPRVDIASSLRGHTPSPLARALQTVLVLLVSVLFAILWFLPWTPAREWTIVTMLIAIDKPISCAALVSVLAFIWAARKGWRRPLSITMASASLVVAGLFGGRTFAQGIENPAVSIPENHVLTAISWNAAGVHSGEVAERIFDNVTRYSADVVVLPETGWLAGENASAVLSAAGFENTVFAPDYTATSILLNTDLAEKGRYELDTSSPPWAGLVIRPERPSAETPIIIGTHLQQPSPGNVTTWREHLAWVEGLCNESPYVIAVGDFNATLNNLGGDTVGACTDIAAQHRAGATSTWPSWLPSFLGVSIDRGLLGPAYSPENSTFSVLDDVDTHGTDHRPILISVSR